MKIEYTKVGDYYLPNLYYPEETRPIGLWGMLRKEYLKEHKSGTYTNHREHETALERE